MNDLQNETRSLLHVAAEHRDLQRRSVELARLVREPLNQQHSSAAFAEVALRVRELQNVLKQHFAEEAAGGYLEEAISRVPRLASEANAVEGQHPGLLREVAALLATLKTAKPSVEAWRETADAVAQFAARLLAHETAENRILQEGFNEDPAVFDMD